MRWAIVLTSSLVLVAVAFAFVITDQAPVEDAPLVRLQRDASWFDSFERLVSVIGVPAAIFGLALVAQQLRATHRAQRVEWGPYVRIDIGPTDSTLWTDIQLEEPYYQSDHQALEIRAGTDEPAAGLSAFFRNYQAAPLGVAYGVRASFVLEIHPDVESDQIEGYWHELEVPYLEHGKPVRLEAFRFPATTNATVRVVSLDYQDIYSRGIRSKHLAGPEVWHGRLQCHYEQGVFSAEPVYEPPPRSAWNRIRFHLSGRHGERGNDGDT